MSFPVNSYEVHAQRIHLYDGLAPDWNWGEPDQVFCRGKRQLRNFVIGKEFRDYAVAREEQNFSIPAQPVIVKPAKETSTC